MVESTHLSRQPPAMIFSLLALCVVPLLVVYARLRLYHAYRRASVGRAACQLSGRAVAERLLRRYGLDDVGVTCGRAPLSDQFDPRSRLLRLSPQVYFETSVTSAAVAAHEVGHALQHRRSYLPLRLRNGLAPLSNLGNGSLFVALALSFIFRVPALAWISGGIFAALLLPSLVGFLVELDASRQARAILREAQIVSPGEQDIAEGFLRVAMGTYLALALGMVLATTFAVLLATRELSG